MADIAVLGIGIDTRNGEKKAADLATGLKNISSAADSVGKSSGTMTGSFIKAQLALDALKKVTSFVVGQFSSAIEAGKRFEESMSQVKAVSGATSAQFADLTAAAKAMGEQTKFSASEAADGLVLLSQAGLKAEQSIAALPDVLNLAAAGGLSMGQAADIATNAMSGMRLQVSDLTRITDVFAKTASSSNTNVGAMGESFKYVASIGASAGVSVERLSAMIGILGNAGIQGSMAGTQLAFGISKMASEGKDFFEVLKELERTGADTAKVMDMFGERAGRAVLAILGQGVGTLEKFESELMNSAGAAKTMADIMSDSLSGDLKNLDSIIEGVRISFYDTFNDDLRAIVKNITAAIRENKDSILELASPVPVLTGYFADLSKQAGGVFTILESLNGVIKVAASGVLILGSMVTTLGANIGRVLNAANLIYEKRFVDAFYALKETGEMTVDSVDDLLWRLDELWTKQKKVSNGAATTKSAFDSLIQTMGDLGKSSDFSGELSEASWMAAEMAVKHATKALKEQEEEILTTSDTTRDLIDGLFELGNQYYRNLNASDETTTSLNEQNNAVSRLSEAYGMAAEKAEQFAKGSIAARFAQSSMDQTGSITGLSLYGQTFSVQNPVSAPASSSFASSSFSAPQTSSGNSLSNLLSRYERLSASVADYMSRDTAVDIKLQDAKAELREISLELASISENDLEKRLELSERYFETSKNIETLQKSIAREQQTALSAQRTSAEGLNSILGSVLSDMDELIAGDFSNALPVEQLAALEAQFTATKNAIDSIDWTDITTADQQLISQFQNVGKEFLKQSQEVFKSSGNYDVIKDSVTAEFDDLAAKLVTAMAKADPTVFNENMDKLGTNFSTLYSKSDSARTGVIKLTNSLSANTGTTLSGSSVGASTNINTLADAILNNLGFSADETKTKTNAFSETLSQLASANQNAGDSAISASNSAAIFSSGVNATASPLENANSNLSALANNTASTMNFMAQQMAALKSAIESGQSSVGGTAPATEPISQPVAETWQKLFSQKNNFTGLYEAFAIGSLGSTKKLPAVFYSQPYFSSDAKISGTGAMDSNLNYEIIGGNVFKNGYQVALATGAWSINRPTQNATLHSGEMVIRSEDANFVRASLSSAGRADSYGQPNGMTSSGNDKQIIYVLSAILDELRENRNPVVVMNARRVSEEIDRFKALSS